MCCAAQTPLQDLRAYNLSCWKCHRKTDHSWHPSFRIACHLVQGHIPFSKQPASNDWSMSGIKARCPCSNSGKCSKAIVASECSMGGLRTLSRLHHCPTSSSACPFPSPVFHRHCFPKSSPINFQQSPSQKPPPKKPNLQHFLKIIKP